MSGWFSIIAAAIAFAITASLGKVTIPFLHKLHYGQTIKEIGPTWHQKKQGTPTMGGIMFITGIIIAAALAVPAYYFASREAETVSLGSLSVVKIWAGVAMGLAYGIIGFADDYIKVVKKQNLGLTAKQKLAAQILVGAAYLGILALFGGDSTTLIPFAGAVKMSPYLYYPLALFIIVGFVNAVNLTDGIDGLAASVTGFAAIVLMTIASLRSVFGMSILAACVAGGCIGFLIWNFFPAKVFMGDTGSLFLGGMFVALAFGMDLPIIIIPVGIIYLCEAGSVMLQVAYFKITHGKRIFKMSPIHHHFEMSGWSEVKIVSVFSAVTLIFGIITILLVYFGLK
ncbi:MAG: phospho-N-acetylmuramoyl-pentapeptide-transferase [Clostridia bacterium]|nr:phospho-N-acetylmuramoyl-pentapeptide-transferase [Clostridia bacterium]